MTWYEADDLKEELEQWLNNTYVELRNHGVYKEMPHDLRELANKAQKLYDYYKKQGYFKDDDE